MAFVKRHLPLFTLLAITAIAWRSVPGTPFWGDDFEILAFARAQGANPFAGAGWLGAMFWTPIPRLLWWMEFHLFGDSPWPWHAVNLALHLTNVALFYRFTSELFEDKAPAFIGVLLWSVHFSQSEAVFWMVDANHLLAFLGMAVSLLFFLRWWKKGSRGALALGLAGFAFALASRESAASLPLLLVLTAAVSATPVFSSARVKFKAAIGKLAPFAGLGALYAAFQLAMRQSSDAGFAYYESDLLFLAKKALYMVTKYAGLSGLLTSMVQAGLLALVLIAAYFVVRSKALRFGLLWAVAAYLPFLAIPMHASRYDYFVLPGLGCALAGAALWLDKKLTDGLPRRTLRLAGSLALIVWVLFHGLMLEREAGVYARWGALYEETLQKFDQQIYPSLDLEAPLLMLNLDDRSKVHEFQEKLQEEGDRLRVMFHREGGLDGLFYMPDLVSYASYRHHGPLYTLEPLSPGNLARVRPMATVVVYSKGRYTRPDEAQRKMLFDDFPFELAGQRRAVLLIPGPLPKPTD